MISVCCAVSESVIAAESQSGADAAVDALQGNLSPLPISSASAVASIGAAAVRHMERFLLQLETEMEVGTLSKEGALKLAQERRAMKLEILQSEIARQDAT